MKVNWGDGSISEYPEGVFQASHIYSSVGTWPVTVWVLGQGQWRNNANCQQTVVIAPQPSPTPDPTPTPVTVYLHIPFIRK
jgi:hypothetical protein